MKRKIMKRDRFTSQDIMCEVYWNPNIELTKLAIYQYGFPGSIGKNTLIDFLTDNGIAVILPHFPGTFDSGSNFTPKETVSFYSKISECITEGNIISLKKNKPLNLPKKIELAFGHSYGCWSVLRGVEHMPDVEYMFLFGPAITYAELKYETNCGLIENGKEHIKMVQRTRPFTYRLKDVEAFNRLYSGEYDLFNITNNNIKNIIGFVGSEDSYFDLDKLKIRFPLIINASFKNNLEIELIEVQNATHSLDSILTEETKSRILCYL